MRLPPHSPLSFLRGHPAQDRGIPPDVFGTRAHEGHYCIDVTCPIKTGRAIAAGPFIGTSAISPTLDLRTGTGVITKTLYGVRTNNANIHRVRNVPRTGVYATFELGDKSPNFQVPT